MMVNVKLAKDGDGENNVKSWIAKLPADGDVSIFCYIECKPKRQRAHRKSKVLYAHILLTI